MIKHSVIFKLKHEKGSPEEKTFFERVYQLANIPGVKNFECLTQVSTKNQYDFGICMEFDNETLYAQYNNHQDHSAFIKECWIDNVTDFLEIDYVPLEEQGER